MRVCKNTNGDDWEDVVNQDSKLLMNFADRGGGRIIFIRHNGLYRKTF